MYIIQKHIKRFCGLKGHEMFCQVERAYIEDGFNLYGLRACVSNFSDCLDLILDRIGPEDSDDSHLTQSACTLYGLIHARYIVTTHGLDSMYNKVCKMCSLLMVCAYHYFDTKGIKDPQLNISFFSVLSKYKNIIRAVRRERIWYMSPSPMQWTAGPARGITWWNRRRHCQNLLSKV